MRKLSYRNKLRLKQTTKTVLLAVLLVALVISFYLIYLQRHLIYSRDGVRLDFSQTTEDIPLNDTPDGTQSAAPLPRVEIVYVDDSSSAGALSKVSGYYVDGQMLTERPGEVARALEALTEPCWIMLDLKNTAGKFYYSTKITGAETVEPDTAAVDELISSLNSRGFQLMARLPAFADSAFALEHMDCALSMENGVLWADADGGYWLDPANSQVQDYLQQICKELSSLGFSEIVFADFYFPTSGNISYESTQTKAEIINSVADTLKNAFTASNLLISFCTAEATFPLDSVSGRLYFTGAAGANVETIVTAAADTVTDTATQLVFLTDSHDTRFDAYCTLRPLLEPEHTDSAEQTPPAGDTESGAVPTTE